MKNGNDGNGHGGFRQDVRYIPLDQIDTRPRYQRVRDKGGSLEAQVKKIAANFKPSRFQIPDVYDKENEGALYICGDGAGRIGALRLLGYHGTHCRVIPFVREKVQSTDFVAFQKDRKRVSGVDEFIADLADPTIQSIKAVLREEGYASKDEVNGRESYPLLSGGIETIKVIWEMPRGPDRLRRSLRMAKEWANGKRQVTGVMLQTVLCLITGQSELEGKVIRTMHRVSVSEAVKSVIEEHGKFKSRHLPPHVAKYVANAHNKGRSEHRLDLAQIDKTQAEFLKYAIQPGPSHGK